MPTNTCSKPVILVKSTTALKLGHLKEQAQKLATRMSFLPDCSIQSSKCLLETPSSMKMLETYIYRETYIYIYFSFTCCLLNLKCMFCLESLKPYILNLLKKWNKKLPLAFFFLLCLNPSPTPFTCKTLILLSI